MKKKVVGGQYYTFYANEIKMHASEHFKRHPPYGGTEVQVYKYCTGKVTDPSLVISTPTNPEGHHERN